MGQWGYDSNLVHCGCGCEMIFPLHFLFIQKQQNGRTHLGVEGSSSGFALVLSPFAFIIIVQVLIVHV